MAKPKMSKKAKEAYRSQKNAEVMKGSISMATAVRSMRSKFGGG